jgi:hypothetical protein
MLVLAIEFSRSPTNGAEGASFVGTERTAAEGGTLPFPARKGQKERQRRSLETEQRGSGSDRSGSREAEACNGDPDR